MNGTGILQFVDDTLFIVNDEIFDEDGFTVEEGEAFDIRLQGVWMSGNYEKNPARIVFSDASYCGLVSGMIVRSA